jgi:3-phenylpropionate/cinnamic acid dioxygenase small subunit
LLDRAAIHDVIMRYAAGVDRRDFTLVAACFAADVTGDFAGQSWESRDALVEFISGVRYFHTTMHMMGNQFIEVAGDSASLDSYAMLTHHATRPGESDWLLNRSANLYVEKLERRDGSWVIARRGGEPSYAPTGVTAVKSDDLAVRWLLDRAEIHDLMMSYALGVDLRDYERIAACFAPRFRAVYFDREFTEVAPLLDFIRGVELFESTTHFLGNQLIEIDGDSAAMETVAMITHRPRSTDGEKARESMAGASSYVDRLERVAGRWRFAERGSGTVSVPSGRARVPRSDDPQVQWLLDRSAIHDCVVESSFALDRGDASWPHATTHFLGNQLIEIDSDNATAETYVYITTRETPESRVTHWSAGARRFLDRLVREDGGWRLAERRIVTNRIPD